MTIKEQEEAWYEDALEMELQDHEEAIGESGGSSGSMTEVIQRRALIRERLYVKLRRANCTRR